METFKTKAYGATGSVIGGKKLEEMEVERTMPEANEVLIDILYCGVCHSDIHQVNNDWSNTIYPCIPGHEIIGRIEQTGAGITAFNIGDIVGVGCMIDSCGHCHPCQEGEEQYCQGPVGPTMTYNGYFKPDGSGFNTFGGYSTKIVVKESFVLKIPEGLDVSSAAPILCAGVTTYSPLKRARIGKKDTVGIIGIGGLGHMAVKIAAAMGAEVTAITTNKDKRGAALALGASKVLLSDNKKEMQQYEEYFSFLLITIPEPFDLTPYITLLKPHGSIVTVGLLGPYKKPLNNMEVASKGKSIGGSMIGGIAETKEVIEFCAEHKIAPEVEMIGIKDINKAFDKIKDEDVRFRYVIDMQSLRDQ